MQTVCVGAGGHRGGERVGKKGSREGRRDHGGGVGMVPSSGHPSASLGGG